MTAILRATLLAALAASSIPVVATGQGTSTDSLLRRIDLLERRTADLEQRVHELEAVIKSEPSQGRPIQASTRWRDLANWRQLHHGMKMDEVRALLGEPERVEALLNFTTWSWGHFPDDASLRFDNDKLAGWSEPRQ
jgi:hypothetical protein